MFGRGWYGHGGPRSRFFEKGDLKYVILDLLAERPRHGYDIIQELEERFRGLYSPSPGSVYPILQMLEDMGHVTPEQREGRKVYSITEGGRRFLAEHRDQIDEIWARLGHWAGQGQERGRRHGHGDRAEATAADWHAHIHEIKYELKELLHLFGRRAWGRQLDPAKMRRIREVVTRARQEIEAILNG